jgi:hypothetical protein
MGQTANPTRQNRTITVDVHDETTDVPLLGNTQAFVAFGLAFILSSGFQLIHKAHGSAGGSLTRHSHDARVRLGGLTIWRGPCTRCQAVFTVLPHCVLRYCQMPPAVAQDALLATHGGLSLERCAVLYPLSPMALDRVVWALGQQRLVMVLTRWGLALPGYCLADAQHSRCLTAKVYLPTIVHGRVSWHLGYTEEASTAALTQSYGVLHRTACQQEPTDRVRGILTDGCDSTHKSMRTVCPGARLGTCWRHAVIQLPGTRAASASPVRQAVRSRLHPRLYRARQRQGLRIFALGQRVRHVAAHVTAPAGTATGARVRRWIQAKNAGW